MIVYKFTIPQIEYYRTFCNFTKKEEELFELRIKEVPLDRCAEIMGYENIKRLSQRVNNKIVNVTNVKRMEQWIENVYWKNVLEQK